MTLHRCEEAVRDLSNFFDGMATKNGGRSTRGLKGGGPEGNISEVGRSQLHWMLEGIGVIKKDFELLGRSDLIAKVNPTAMQELVCELFFADMRVNNPMPSIVEYYLRRSSVVLEGRKRRGYRRCSSTPLLIV